MNEWHIFTKDGNEYAGEKLTFESGFAVLFRIHLLVYFRDKRDWKKLWLKKKTIKWNKEKITYDYMIPVSGILRIERHDVQREHGKDGSDSG